MPPILHHRPLIVLALLAALVLCLCPGRALCQETPLPPPVSPSLQPAPPVPSPPPEAPSAQMQAEQYDLTAARVRVGQQGTMAEGDVQVKTRDFSVSARSVTVSPDNVSFEFLGEVVVGSEQLHTTATSLRINIDTGRWQVTDARTEISPELLGGDAAEPLFVQGKRVFTPETTGGVEAVRGLATTCDLDDPHYFLRSARISLVPERKVTLERPELYVLGHRLFRSPIDVSLRLDRKDNRIVPEVGRNEVEGFFIKLGYPYSLNAQNDGQLRLNFTELRGIGLGFDHRLDAAKHTGEWTVLWEPAESALSSRLNWDWRVSDAWTSDLTSNYQQDSGYYGNSTTLDDSLNIARVVGSTRTQIGLQHYLSSSDSSQSTRYSSALNHQQQFGTDSSLYVRTNLSSSRYSADQPYDRELTGAVEFRDRRKRFDWTLSANDRFDLDGTSYTGDDSHRSLNKLPELTATTDERRLGIGGFLGKWGLRASGGAGHYEQEPDGLRVNRAALQLNLGGREIQIAKRTRLRLAGRYYQSVYDEGSAQFQLGVQSDLTQQLNDNWQVRASYSQISPSGFAPIRLDYWGRQHDATVQLVGLAPDHYRVDLSSGFDFLGDTWRTVTGQFEYMTSSRSRLQLQTGYDIEAATWRPADVSWEYVQPERLRLSVGSQYDIDASQLQQVDLGVDWLVTEKTRIEANARYSGFTHSVDDLDIRLTRDLHCWVASVAWSKLTNDFQVNLGLKAFPSVKANFGTPRGVSFQSGDGAYY